MTTLIEAFSAVLLSLGSLLILRTLWRLDAPARARSAPNVLVLHPYRSTARPPDAPGGTLPG